MADAPEVKKTKSQQKSEYANKIKADSDYYTQKFNEMSDEDKIAFVYEDHTDSFKDANGKPLRDKWTADAWEGISKDPNIPESVRQKWASISDPTARAKSIKNYSDALVKMAAITQGLISAAVLADPSPENMEKIAAMVKSAMTEAYNEVCIAISEGKELGNGDVASRVTASITKAVSGVDKNSDLFKDFAPVMKMVDPKYNTFLNC